MDEMLKMKLHDILTPAIEDNLVEIIRVPGGWLYKFYEKTCGVDREGVELYNSQPEITVQISAAHFRRYKIIVIK